MEGGFSQIQSRIKSVAFISFNAHYITLSQHDINVGFNLIQTYLLVTPAQFNVIS